VSVQIRTISDRYLRFLTDDFGIWQHTRIDTIDRTRGYALDDSARALVAAAWQGAGDLARVYLGYIEASCVTHGRFILYFDARRLPLPEEASEDAIGEAFWALGECVRLGIEVVWARRLAQIIEHRVVAFTSNHGKAYALLGALTLNQALAQRFADESVRQFQLVSNENWRYVDHELRYANALMPYALLEAGQALTNSALCSVGLDILDFLNNECQLEDVPIAIGNQGWHRHGEEKALYDQQPIDPAYQVLANSSAYRLTGEGSYKIAARTYMEWFWGNNLIGRTLIDTHDEGVFDGFNREGVSLNKGSENIACYLLAQKAFEAL
jgi:hypothetical protein